MKDFDRVAKGSRDTHEDVDTVIAVSSDEIAKARAAAVGGLNLEDTSTVDCHPLILEEGAELGSESGFVRKPRALGTIDPNRKVTEDTETVSLVAELPAADLEESDEITVEPIDIGAAAAAVVAAEAEKPDETDPTLKPQRNAKTTKEEVETDPTLKPPAEAKQAKQMTPAKQVKPAKPVAPPADFDDETKTRQREALRVAEEPHKEVSTEPIPIDKAKMLAPPSRDQTMPMPILGDIGGALETVPLNANLVQQVLQQVDARAAARAAGQPVPAFALQAPPDPLKATAPSQQRMPAIPPTPVAPPRRVGIEVAIAIFAFLVVAVPALYYMWIHFQN